ncbi:MAG TPA: adenylate/guanylate cyclase domain-containing protein [Thermohalobaculum sp.]|nr:adenylate/guanylate cyclase domain-containing protein [Thermohalobaculum sp.]
MSGAKTQRRLSAILAADVVGYSTLMAADEAGTLAALRAHRTEIFDPETEKRGGRIVKLMGDGVLVEFPSVVDAVECALAIQAALAEQGGPIRLRIGINLGDVIIDGDDIYGDGVNVAARLEALAEPGGICIASIVQESIGNRVEVEFADAGEHEVKGIKRPIRVFRWPDAGAGQVHCWHCRTNPRSPSCPSTTCRATRSRSSLPTELPRTS